MNDQKQWITFGIIGLGVLGLAIFFARQNSTSYAVDSGQASVANSVVAANANAQSMQLAETLGIAKLVQEEGIVNNNNQATLALNAQNGATQLQLARMAQQATQFSVASDTIVKLKALGN